MKKTIAILLTSLLAVTLLASCAANRTDSANETTMLSLFEVDAPAMAPAPDSAYFSFEDSFDEVMLQMEVAPGSFTGNSYDGAGFVGSAVPISESAPGSDGFGTPGSQSSLAERIIFTVWADIETLDFDQTIESVYALLAQYGGFIENSHVDGVTIARPHHWGPIHRTASFHLRIPVHRLEAATRDLSRIGNVTSTSRHSENITMQFTDTQSRLASLRTQEGRLLDMMERAYTVEDLILIEDRLSFVRSDIEWMTSRLQNWQNQVDYSTLSLFIREVEILTEEDPDLTYWQQVRDGLSSTMRGIGRFFMNAFRWLVTNLPIIAIIAAVAVVVTIIVVRSIRRMIKKRKAKKAPQETEA
ncbi:MAG: DUF4349 domain-containing protein [Oscillospiraceae bacterium]|nr:DUF4349 domain-containing protein [Oscillospiraceae bacterium]